MDEWTAIKVLRSKNVPIKQIAKQLKLSKNTVKKYLKSLDTPKYNYTLKLNDESKSRWNCYKTQILDMYYNKRFIGTRILNELRKQGAKGSNTAFYDFFKKIKLQNISGKIHQRFETDAGCQAQFDWSEYTVLISNEYRKIYIFSLILSYSRYKYFIASLDITQYSILEALENGFIYFGGTVKQILTDNAKQMVDNASRKVFRWNKKFYEFLSYYSVTPIACKVKHAFTKGKVENPFYYLENHFIKGSAFSDFDELQKKLLNFTNDFNNKMHTGINDIPKNKYEKEKEYLQGLPPSYFVSMKEEWRKSNFDCLLSFEGNKYSVPDSYASKYVWVRKYLGYKIQIFSQKGNLIAEHLIPKGKQNIIIHNKHYERLKNSIPNTTLGLKREFITYFPEHKIFLEKLYAAKKHHFRYHLGKILSLCNIYKKDDVRQAIEVSLECNIFNYDYLFAYLTSKTDIEYKKADQLLLFDNKELEETNITRDLSYYENIGG